MTMVARWIVTGVFLLVVARGAAAQSTQATTVPIDRSTPRGTLKLLATAMDSGDRAAIRDVFHTTSSTEDDMVSTMSDMAEALTSLRGAAKEAYGEEGVKALAGDREAQLAEGLSKLDGAVETIDGDSAQVTTDDPQAQPVKLVRIEGQWKVPMADLAPTLDPDVVSQRLADLTVQINLISQTADEIAAGKYPTPEAAGEALSNKMMKAAMQQAAPPASTQTTAPTTAPEAPTTQAME